MPVINFKTLGIGDGDDSWDTSSRYNLCRIVFRTLGYGIR